MENSILQVTATIDPRLLTPQDRLFWRFACDSIWQGRLVATRWLIEFVGIKEGDNCIPVQCWRNPRFPHDVFIDDLAGGALFSPTAAGAQLLARVWGGCSQASGHATTDTHIHHPINETPLADALKAKASMAKLAEILSGKDLLDRPVIDLTGLTGLYNIMLDWVAEPAKGRGPAAEVPDPQSRAVGPSLLEAIRSELGLKLELKRRSIDIFVIDHIEKTPTEN